MLDGSIDKSRADSNFNRLIAGAALVLTLPLLLGIGFFIWYEDRGPVLRRVQRRRCDGDVVVAFAFRCNQVNPERVSTRLSDEAKSLTAIGTLLRRYSLARIPQLWNVLRGELSLRDIHL